MVHNNAIRLLVLVSSLAISNGMYAFGNGMGWIPEPPMERVHLTHHVGEKFSIITPNSTTDFCKWRFIFYATDAFYSYQEGIDFINSSGVIKFKKTKFEKMYNKADRAYYDCLKEEQRVMIFKAVRPGRVIFYMQNKPSWQTYQTSYHGCYCSPTIREFIVDVI